MSVHFKALLGDCSVVKGWKSALPSGSMSSSGGNSRADTKPAPRYEEAQMKAGDRQWCGGTADGVLL